MKVRILPAALKDLEIGSQFYEEQEPGIGQQYLDDLFARLHELETTAGIHRLISGQIGVGFLRLDREIMDTH